MTKPAKKDAKSGNVSIFAIVLDHSTGKVRDTKMRISGDRSLLPLSQSVMLETESNATKRSLAYYLWKVSLNAYKLRFNRRKSEYKKMQERKGVEEKAKVTEERQKDIREKIRKGL